MDGWDSSANENRPPQAVKVSIEFEAQASTPNAEVDPNRDRPRPPLTFMCAIAAQPKAADDVTSETGS